MAKRIELAPESAPFTCLCLCCLCVLTLIPCYRPKFAVLNGNSTPTRTYNVRFVETEEDYDRVIKVRVAVFVEEQGYALEDELDEYVHVACFFDEHSYVRLAERDCFSNRKDPESDHFLMTTTGADGKEEDAGTIRWWPKPNQAAGKMGRVAGEFCLCPKRKVSLPFHHRAYFPDRWASLSPVMPKFRGGGTGKLLINAMEEHVRQRKGKAGLAAQGYPSVRVHCHSQMHAEGFYAKSGYLRQGDQFMEVRDFVHLAACLTRIPLMGLAAVREKDGAPHCLLVKDIELVPEN